MPCELAATGTTQTPLMLGAVVLLLVGGVILWRRRGAAAGLAALAVVAVLGLGLAEPVPAANAASSCPSSTPASSSASLSAPSAGSANSAPLPQPAPNPQPVCTPVTLPSPTGRITLSDRSFAAPSSLIVGFDDAWLTAAAAAQAEVTAEGMLDWRLEYPFHIANSGGVYRRESFVQRFDWTPTGAGSVTGDGILFPGASTSTSGPSPFAQGQAWLAAHHEEYGLSPSVPGFSDNDTTIELFVTVAYETGCGPATLQFSSTAVHRGEIP